MWLLQGKVSSSIDGAYQMGLIVLSLYRLVTSTDSTPSVDARSFASQQRVWAITSGQTNQQETISKGYSDNIARFHYRWNSLTEAGSKTTVEVEYPSDIEFISLRRTQLYQQMSCAQRQEWWGGDHRQVSYSGTPKVCTSCKVPSNSTRANGSSFTITLKTLKDNLG